MFIRPLVIFVTLAVLLSVSVAAPRDGFGPGPQDWGYITVREGAHMFYWLYYTTGAANYTDRPLAVWLQGGPGASSAYGNFEEFGPWDVYKKPRDYTWVKDMNVVFIDNPVGTGFSYVDNEQYAENNTQIALDLVEFMKGFYQQNSEFKTVPLHIFCESYGGKMAAEFALELYRAVERKEIESNLQSVGLGDTWVSPMDSMDAWAPLLLNTGMVDQKGYEQIMNVVAETQKAVDSGDYVTAERLWSTSESTILQLTAKVDFYNILSKVNPSSSGATTTAAKYKNALSSKTCAPLDNEDATLNSMMDNEVMPFFGIPKAGGLKWGWGSQDGDVFRALMPEFMKPVLDVVEELLNSTDVHVVVYSGQLDLICATLGTEKWVDRLNWPRKDEYVAAERSAFKVNGIVEGFQKKIDKFSFYWVNRAGHMVPRDNPAGMNYILKAVTNF